MIINAYVTKILCQMELDKFAVKIFGLNSANAIHSFITAHDESKTVSEPRPYSQEAIQEASKEGQNIARVCVRTVNGQKKLFVAFTCVEYHNGFEKGYKDFAEFSETDLKKIMDFYESE